MNFNSQQNVEQQLVDSQILAAGMTQAPTPVPQTKTTSSKEESTYLGSTLALPMGQTHLPHPRFNLYHIDNQELHFESINVSAFLLDADLGDYSHKEVDQKLESALLLQNGVLHFCSRSLVFDQDVNLIDKKLPDLTKFRFNSKFDFEVLSGEQLEGVHSQMLELHGRGEGHRVPQNLVLLDYFYKYLLFQTFPEVLSPSLQWNNNGSMEDYSQILDRSSFAQFQQDLQEMQLVLVSVQQLIKIPRSPPGPSYVAKDIASNQEEQGLNSKALTSGKKYMLLVLQDDDLEKQNEALTVLQKLTKPSSLGDDHLYLSEDDIIAKHVTQLQKKYMDFLKETESQYKQKVKELNQEQAKSRPTAQMSSHLYKIKQIVQRVTIEGEHTCLMLLKQDQTQKDALCLEVLPIMNAPYQNQATLSIELDQIKIAHVYRYLFQYRSLRIVTENCEEYIFQFQKQKYCQRALEVLLGQTGVPGLCPNVQTNIFTTRVEQYQDAWQRGMLSNGDYLLFLNFVAHRSFNDVTQYPIFPWIVQDYKFEYLDLSKTMTFRDLSKPIGAHSTEKLETFKSKYFEIVNKQSINFQSLGTEAGSSTGSGEKPYMYLSHYSTPGIVLYYLIRQVPSYILKIQNESVGGPPDKIFHDVNISWQNVLNILSDNKELIPEFYFGDGSFMKNKTKLELGLNHLQQKVGDVSLPRWASSHQDFVMKNRYALESNHVSANLHKWIDLVFGYLQRGDRAQFSNNLFQPHTLEEHVDFSQLTNPLQIDALTTQIRNFGQCPKQLFQNAPHPQRLIRTISIEPKSASAAESASTPKLELQYVQTLQQELLQAKVEIQRLMKEIEAAHKEKDESLLRQIQEFKALDDHRRRTMMVYKQESNLKFDKMKANFNKFIEMKQKEVQMKSETEGKSDEKSIKKEDQINQEAIPVINDKHHSQANDMLAKIQQTKQNLLNQPRHQENIILAPPHQEQESKAADPDMGEKNQPPEQTKEAEAQPESNKMEINMNRIQQMKKKRFASKKKDSSAKMF